MSAGNSFLLAGDVSSTSVLWANASFSDAASRLRFHFRQKYQPTPAAMRRQRHIAATMMPIVAAVESLFGGTCILVGGRSSIEGIDVMFCEALDVHFACETRKVERS